MSDKVKVFLLLLGAVIVSSIGEALCSKGMKQAQEAGNFLTVLNAAIHDWHVLLGVFLLIIYVGLYVYALGLAELSFAIPLLAFSYLFGLVSSKYYLHEDIKPGRLIGTAIIIAGVLTVAFTGSGGDSKKSGESGDKAAENRSSKSE